MIDTTDLTPAQQNAVEAEVWEGPSEEDMQWYLSEHYVDPMEEVL